MPITTARESGLRSYSLMLLLRAQSAQLYMRKGAGRGNRGRPLATTTTAHARFVRPSVRPSVVLPEYFKLSGLVSNRK